MEVAQLVLQFVSVLIWPVLLLAFLAYFRRGLKGLLERVVRESRKIDFELAGQKVSVTLAKELVRGAIQEAVSEAPKAAGPERIDQIASSTAQILSVLPLLENRDLALLESVRAGETRLADRAVPERAAVGRLAALGLVHIDRGTLSLTDIGERVHVLTEGRDVYETMHRIGQAM